MPYTTEEVKKLLKIQRENCYVAIYNKTLDENLARVCAHAPEPSGGKWIGKEIVTEIKTNEKN